ncbi:glutamate racemase [Marinomonas algarum]|uniref:Glutamate racemase n=1 Tax=Marinomonas algarum TaxID=2883105 RepID=A0A9X1IP33_9GAMM|nr:glutamate racemase [Marinomonas algarum]MCB5161871.1 glutamate racemase [Marinomonas algarum]
MLKIGVLDSGAGGLTILNRIHHALPCLDLLYLADEQFAPYGDKTVEQLQSRLLAMGRFFEEEQVAAIVVACNTATVVAIDALRSVTRLPVIGVEPAVKPACRISKRRKVAVLATPVTAKSARLNKLIDLWKADSEVVILSSATLAFDIDAWPKSKSRIVSTIHCLSQEMKAKHIDTLVLACTHYPLVKSIFEQALGMDCDIIEPSEGVTSQLIRRLTSAYPLEMHQITTELQRLPSGAIELCSSKNIDSMSRLRAWVTDQDAICGTRQVALSCLVGETAKH